MKKTIDYSKFNYRSLTSRSQNLLSGDRAQRLRNRQGGLRATNSFQKPSVSQECDLVIVVDATYSQSWCWDALQQGMDHLIADLHSFSEKMRIAMVAYRDYYNQELVKEVHGFSSDAAKLQSFARGIQCIGNDSDPEAIEVGLNAAINLFQSSSSPSKKQVMVLIGDWAAHGVLDDFDHRSQGITYLTETHKIKHMRIPIYSVFSGTDEQNYQHFKWYADQTGGTILRLENISDLTDIIALMVGKEIGKLAEAQQTILRRLSTTDSKRQRLADMQQKLMLEQ